MGYAAVEDIRIIPPIGTQCILSCFKGPDFHKKLLDFEKEAAAKPSPSALSVANINDWFSLLELSRRNPDLLAESFTKLLASLPFIDCQDGSDFSFYFSSLPSIVNKLFFINNIPIIPLKLKQPEVVINSLLDLDLLDLEEREALSLGSSPSSSATSFDKSVPKSFSSIIPLLPPRQVELDAIRLDNKLWDFELINHKSPFSISSLALICSLTIELIDQWKTSAIQATKLISFLSYLILNCQM